MGYLTNDTGNIGGILGGHGVFGYDSVHPGYSQQPNYPRQPQWSELGQFIEQLRQKHRVQQNQERQPDSLPQQASDRVQGLLQAMQGTGYLNRGLAQAGAPPMYAPPSYQAPSMIGSYDTNRGLGINLADRPIYNYSGGGSGNGGNSGGGNWSGASFGTGNGPGNTGSGSMGKSGNNAWK